ncbi:Dam family site-specific DNA-(adenine-N6)-methyltransferase [Candidatus Bathyarchaeota archaeon]|nr:Dam family site-specific DNA-(adenine-N6)-methyltransferase [Candidatus Bathyarchaeota archaeon]
MDSPLKWVGSKRLLRRRICRLIPEDHETYVEPFAGSAAIFFFKNSTRQGNQPKPSRVEVLGDIDSHLMNFYRVVQDERFFGRFMRRLRCSLVARDFFMEYRCSKWDDLEPVERAFRMYYIVKNAYGGLFRFNKKGTCNSPFASTPDKKARSYMFKEYPLMQAHKRLKQVHLHELPFHEVVKKYDSQKTFFYLDPPYETEYAYNCPFDHEFLLETCRNIKGRFLLSLNSGFREIFSEFNTDTLEVNYSVTCKPGNNSKREILVNNYASP